MPKDTSLTQETFDLLLHWLDPDRDGAAQKYESIRQRLIRMLVSRGCYEAEELADESINRVTAKIPEMIDTYVGEPALYFYGTANNVYMEWLRRQKKKHALKLIDNNDRNEDRDEDETAVVSDHEYDCLESCLGSLPARHHELIVEYYREEKAAKIELRKRLANELGMTIGALQVKTYRIRAGLLKCMRLCLAERGTV